MRARPIIFQGAMVRALIEGRKTQTRRVVKPQPVKKGAFWHFSWGAGCSLDHMPVVPGHATANACPYGIPGDLLWCKETYGYAQCAGPGKPVRACWAYRADRDDPKDYFGIPERRWRPSIHMPRWASRLTLQLTDVRVERVHEISEADARAEGADTATPTSDGNVADRWGTYKGGFSALWDSINSAKGYGWDANPWVWVICFRVIHANVDDVMAIPAAYGIEEVA